MKSIRQQFTVPYSYEVAFTEGLFNPDNPLFQRQIEAGSGSRNFKVFFVFDEGMYRCHPNLWDEIQEYIRINDPLFETAGKPLVIPGGEESKNDPRYVQQILDAVEKHNIDRHSYIVAIGGGAVIDAAGYAAAVAHRGIRLIRVPTTVLSQNDAAIGVKNGINAYGKKNFLGTFVPPFAVLNDFQFLTTLDDRDWRSGISEAVKVALIKDNVFFEYLEREADRLNERNMDSMKVLIHRCAELHLDHIATSGDPFEMGSSRPLDFGHWAAHKLEQLTDYNLRHGEAVAIGIALDAVYSHLQGMINRDNLQRILQLFKRCGFQLFVPELESELENENHPDSILRGLEEFREHLGGQLTIMLLRNIGKGVEVNEVDLNLYKKSIWQLKSYESQPA